MNRELFIYNGKITTLNAKKPGLKRPTCHTWTQ
jgi:hypothetical protein